MYSNLLSTQKISNNFKPVIFNVKLSNASVVKQVGLQLFVVVIFYLNPFCVTQNSHSEFLMLHIKCAIFLVLLSQFFASILHWIIFQLLKPFVKWMEIVTRLGSFFHKKRMFVNFLKIKSFTDELSSKY